MEITITNADASLLALIRAAVKLRPEAKVKVKKADDYHSEALLRSLQADSEAIAKARQNGTLKRYKSAIDAINDVTKGTCGV